ncbi:MAG: DUF1549 domain-containing protein, partial [Planctomycetaceae bacterium]|nr:DUF1549 domain-containing protein [Planctomycetaceae bacterium]
MLSSGFFRWLNPVTLIFSSCCVLVGLNSADVASGADEPVSSQSFFVTKIRPILQEHCISCHGERKQQSGLRLDVRSEVLRGGELYGPAVVADHPERSPLFQAVGDPSFDITMPPEGPALTADEVAALQQWITAGADWPEGADLGVVRDLRNHWSFHPVASVEIPGHGDSTWPQNAIDDFILQRLQQEQLHPAAAADAITWLRRATFDLTGLPPTPAEIDAFLAECEAEQGGKADAPADDSGTVVISVAAAPMARRQVIDRLLASPRYGERWAQHWLDVVRYADTHGFEVNTPRESAWPYRDYVIAAFNQDTPYDQFVREQLAGDLLPDATPDQIIATGYVANARRFGSRVDDYPQHLTIEDTLDNLGRTFLGLTLSCSRCHDHKFDPITNQDYYALYG